MSKQRFSPFLALRFTNFRNYLFGAFVSDMGNQMQIVAVAWQVYNLTHNPAALGLIGLSSFLPTAIFSLPGGLTADKVNRKRLLIVTQTILALLALSLYLMTTTDHINVGVIYLVLFLAASVNSFNMPAQQSIVPHLMPPEYFMNAVSLNSLRYQSATLMGPALAGLLIAGYGVQAVYLFNVWSFLPFILALLWIRVPLHSKQRVVSYNLHSMWEGVHYVATTPILYSTMILDFLATFFGTATILLPIFAKDILHVGPQGLGLLYAAPSLGGVLAGLILSSLQKLKNQGRIIIGAVILYGVATIGFGLSRWLPLSLLFLTIGGFGDMTSTVIRNTIRQMITPDHLRGRMVAAMRIFFQGGPQLGEIEAGYLAAAVGGPVSVIVGGVGTVLITLVVAAAIPALRKFTGRDLAV